MSLHKCNFCGKMRPRVAIAQICSRCAKGRTGDAWCDFCNKTANTELAWICEDCAAGRTGDAWCDFCKQTTNTRPARICRHCSA
jgi:hypothetical protein